MSIPRKVTISCPGCGRKYGTMIFESLNTEFAPNLAETVVSGERFIAKCPSCGFVAHLEYDLLYHDMDHDAMIFAIHKKGTDYQQRLEEIMAMPLPPFYHTLRIVSSMDELREKATCLVMGKDDRIIELCKLLLENALKKQHPEFSVERVFYTYSKGEQIVVFYDGAGRELSCPLDESVYAATFQCFEGIRSQTNDSLWQIIDRNWAIAALEGDPVQPVAKSHQGPVEKKNWENGKREEIEKEQSLKILYCRKCGEKLQTGSLYCGYCGTKVVF